MFPLSTGRIRRLVALAVFALSVWPNGARAQTPSTAPDHDTDAPVIRVYANLLQIPVLILDPFLQPLKPIDPSKFTVQFDDLKPFRPQLVRQEGEDPITLAILIDRTHRNSLLPLLADALATLTPGLLSARDRVVFYATDGCNLRRYGEMLPVQRALLHSYADSAATGSPHDQSSGTCTRAMGFWRSAAIVANSFFGTPGRRILLAVTNGIDTDREYNAELARSVATNNGVAIFSVAERDKVPPGPASSTMLPMGSVGGRGNRSGPPLVLSSISSSDLTMLSERSGGMVLETDAHGLPGTLQHFVTLVRGRYIVEFNRPSNLASGRHILNVSVGQPRYFIRAAGTSMPTQDPTQPDPGVQHGPPSSRPSDPDQFEPGNAVGAVPVHGTSADPPAPPHP